jgi:hypothetical protein
VSYAAGTIDVSYAAGTIDVSYAASTIDVVVGRYASPITEHYAKCNKSVPTHVREWAVEKLGRSAEKRKGRYQSSCAVRAISNSSDELTQALQPRDSAKVVSATFVDAKPASRPRSSIS